MSIDFQGHGLAMDSDGVSAALDVLGVGAAQFWAVLAVETSGVGYLPDRRPAILYEQHIFSRLTKGAYDKSNPDISNPKPGNYGATGAHQYDRLNAAMALDAGAALQSASWGIGQTMGFNFTPAGYPSVHDMVGQMVLSESAQLLGAATFIANGDAIKGLRAGDWAAFAKAYNGPNYAINSYDTKLQAAYQRYASSGTPDLRIRATQLYLTYLGYKPGAIDGAMGSATRSAMNQFQAKQGMAQSASVDDATLAALEAAVEALSSPT